MVVLLELLLEEEEGGPGALRRSYARSWHTSARLRLMCVSSLVSLAGMATTTAVRARHQPSLPLQGHCAIRLGGDAKEPVALVRRGGAEGV